jgi:hypothetical protein
MVRHDPVDKVVIEFLASFISCQRTDVPLERCPRERCSIDLLADLVLLDGEDALTTHGLERMMEATDPSEEVDESETVLSK